MKYHFSKLLKQLNLGSLSLDLVILKFYLHLSKSYRVAQAK